MKTDACSTPVVLQIFNRPELTRLVLERIAAARPKRLFVIADGPRETHPEDVGRCQAARALLDGIDWPCQLQTDFAPANLGLMARTISGLNWVFERVDRAIVLEDDGVPDPTFFRFCEELLARYESNTRVRTVAGSNFLGGKARTSDSYHFSRFHNVWGWATWRRSWRRCDWTMCEWPRIRDEGWLVDIAGSRKQAEFWGPRFNNTHARRNSSWAYRYQLSCWLDGALAITPNRNLVSNLGFGDGATHTPTKKPYMALPTTPMPFPLQHPPFVVVDRLSDSETFKRRFLPENPSFTRWAVRRIYYFLVRKPNVLELRPAAAKLVRPERLRRANQLN